MRNVCLVLGVVFVFLLVCSLFGGVFVLGESVVPPEEDVWVKLAPMQQERCELGAAVVDGKIYAMGGTEITYPWPYYKERKAVDTVEMYDPVTNSWVYQTPMPESSNIFATAVFENKIYCIGAGASRTLNWVYDPASHTWESRAAAPVSMLMAQAHVVGGKIYVLGGSPRGFSNWVYDPWSDNWTRGALIPGGFWGSSVVYEDKIYVVGAYVDPSYWDGSGFNITSEVATLVQVYDPEKDTWTVTATGGPYCLDGLFTLSTSGLYAPPKIYCLSYSQESFGGHPVRGTVYENMAFDLETMSWKYASGLPVMRADAAMVVVDDLVYVIGGYDPYRSMFSGGSNLQPVRIVLGVVERYTPLGYGRVAPVVSVLSLEAGGCMILVMFFLSLLWIIRWFGLGIVLMAG